MALNYLLSPEFQIVNSAGRPASGGFLEVYIHGTRDKYFCASDFDGTLHPFRVPLDSLGSNVVLADDSHAYDVYIYNRYGTLLMSRYNVNPSSGGSMGGTITSSDGSITVTPTVDGYDLSIRDNKASTLRAAAETLYADGFYTFRKLEGEGEAIYLDNGAIKLDDGWYHFSVTVKLNWNGNITPHTGTIRLYSGLTYDIIDFDYSYNHSESILLDGDIFIGAHSSHYISFGRNFSLGITGMPTGMTAELVDCDLHSIIGQGVGGNGEKNIHRLLRYYTNSEEADAEHPAGDWLHDLDAVDPTDPSGHPMVTADQLFAWYDAGQIFELYEVDGSNGQLGWSAVYRMVTWQDQSDWWSQYAPVPGKACRLEFYRMGGYSSVNRGMMIAYIRYKEEDYMRLYQIMPGQDVWTMDFQPELTAGSNISISGSTISATDTTYTAGTGLSLTGTEFSADTSVLATQSDLAGKQDVLTAGSNIQINGTTISATDTTYTAGTGIDITGDVISADTSVVATQSDLAGKQDTLTAGDNITITNNVISASAAPQVQANWNESDTSAVSYIQNKPDLSIYAESANLATVATTGDYDDLTDKPDLSIYAESSSLATVATTGDYDDLTDKPDLSIYAETANLATVATTGDYDDLTDKPDLSIYAESSSLATVATTGDYDDLLNKPTIPSFDSNQMAAINSGVTSTKVGNYDTHIADTTIHVTSTDKTNWNAKEDASNKAQTLDPTSTTEFPSSAAAANFVNSSISTSTANFLGNYDLTDLGLTYPATTSQIETALDGYTFSTTPTNNDYVYVEIENPQTTGIDDEVQRYKFNGTSWLYEYTLNNSSFTAAEKDAIDSGINSTKVGNYDAHIADTDIHVTTSDKSTWNGKQDAISDLQTIRSGASAGATAVQPGDLATVATTGDYDDLIDKPDLSVYAETSDLATVATTGDYDDLINKPTLATVATTGDYADLTNKPSIPAAQVNSDWTATSGVAEILHKPTEKTLAAGSNVTITEANDTVTISATNTTYTAGTGVDITSGVISADTSVLATQQDLSSKQDTLTAGSNISISNNVISATDTTYTFSNPLKNTSGTISLAYDTDTLSASTTRQTIVAAFESVYNEWGQWYYSALSFDDYSGILRDSFEQGAPYGSITLHIPGNTFRYGDTLAVGYRQPYIQLGIRSTFNNAQEAIRWKTPLTYTEDQQYHYYYLDEQDVTITFPMGDPDNWTIPDFSFETYSTIYLSVAAVYDSDAISNQLFDLIDNTQGAEISCTAATTVDGPLTVKDPIPSHTSSDSGKVLGVDSNGDLEWTTSGGGAGGADWDATSGEPGYIENKPTPKVLTAGTNISIAETANALTISATAAPQVQSNWTESNSSAVSYIQHKPTEKTLAAGTGISLTEANDVVTVASSYTAGTGISISSNVISATGVAVAKTTANPCGTFMGDQMYTKLYEFTGTVGTSETQINMTIDERINTNGVNRIWVDFSNTFIQYGSATVILPGSWRLGAGRAGAINLTNSGTGTLSCRCVDTGATALTFFIAIKYTVSSGA